MNDSRQKDSGALRQTYYAALGSIGVNVRSAVAALKINDLAFAEGALDEITERVDAARKILAELNDDNDQKEKEEE